VKNVINTLCISTFSCFFTLWREQFVQSAGDRDSVKRKAAVEKTPNRAGATPLFRLSAAQKVRAVAPALAR
jgi:hypothetical protein